MRQQYLQSWNCLAETADSTTCKLLSVTMVMTLSSLSVLLSAIAAGKSLMTASPGHERTVA